MHTIDQKIYAQLEHKMVFYDTHPLYVINIAILFYTMTYTHVSPTICSFRGRDNQMQKLHYRGYLCG